MRIFLVHRFESRSAAISLLKSIATKGNVSLRPLVLDSFGGEEWQSVALSRITECEAVAVYDLSACMESTNASWEIEQARILNKPLILLDPNKLDEEELKKIYCVYHYDEEFNSFFQKDGKDTEKLYKLMLETSEQLIERRQRLNAFFITAIGSLVAIAGILVKFGTIKSPTVSFLIMSVFGLVALFLCNSWSNLISNYGKLNAAKFRVLLKLEQSLSAQMFSAEWTALGKGRRPEKYQSFTATENMVPLWFALLIFCLVVGASLWRIWY
jgi:hypothetical protein